MSHTGARPAEFSSGVVNALVMVIALQASGNLVNSYNDFSYGVDTVETAGDRCVCLCVLCCFHFHFQLNSCYTNTSKYY